MGVSRLFDLNKDQNSPNRNITPITAELDNSDRMTVGGCLLSDLANQYGTPLYVIDEASIRSSCRAYRKALKQSYPGDSFVLYASKANSSLAIDRIVASEGLGIDVVSEGELITALKSGVAGEQIVLHGNNKSDKELLLAHESNATIIIDNQHDIQRLDKLISHKEGSVRLMLRFTPGIECHTHEYIRTGHLDSKFGFDPEQVSDTFAQLKDYKWAKLVGLHAHIGSQIFELSPHMDLVEVMADFFLRAKDLGHPIKDLNIGGGLGVKYIPSDDPPDIYSWVETVSNAVIKAFDTRNIELPRLICEPGRSIIATAGLTLYRIGARKDIPGGKTYLSIDGGMSDNPRPITYQSTYTACLVDRPLANTDQVVTIAGKHCESGDILLNNIALPTASSGDVLGVFGTGAYNLSMSSNYNRIPRPASVLVNNAQSDLVQVRELPEDLLRYDRLPDRFIAKG
ncbi:diaminopimelate decarboxylase [Prochlorococcus marinus]|uniref:Diaminopimelate decarboxylase n=1 Tax=Prochlorococcus marinus (strain MIT 9211) TaxID=93059 RepID=A9BB15_PROM4|nr:diaminopimelate decarboxylase [Prochlorococcus marinus]ABX09027.1 Diaminopimelate decarboxylase [Prochlorococcus marinus str. MIT 9211]